MKQHSIGRQILYIMSRILYLFLTFGIGYGVAAALMQIDSGALRTLPFLVCFGISLVIQYWLHTLGHWIFGKLSGFQLIAVSFLRRVHVKERQKIVTREPLPESLLTTCLMAPTQSTSRISYTLYWLGGTISNLVVGLVALLFMVLLRWHLDSILGCFCFSLFQAGIFFSFLNALPMYHGSLPNDGLKALLLHKDPRLRSVFTKNLRILNWLSQAKMPLDQIPESLLQHEPFAKKDVFTALLMMRQYELLLWRGSRKEAKDVMTWLFENISYFPEEWQLRIMQESIFLLASDNRDPELVKQLMSDERRDQLADMGSHESFRCLFAWALHSEDHAADAPIYENMAIKAAGRIAFRPAAEAWRRMIIECRWTAERSEDFDLID